MSVLEICTKSTFIDRDGAGWYTPNSVNVSDIRPDQRMPGGGVVSDYLTDLPTAIDRAIDYTKQRISEAEAHLRKLEKAKTDISA